MAFQLISRKTPSPAENRDSEILTVVGVFIVLAAVGLGSRFASKRIIRKPLRSDDYLVVCAFVSGSSLLDYVLIHGGLGIGGRRSSFLHMGYVGLNPPLIPH